ncbi:MAG: T9SS type A sorting domain-containing protein [Bacteroidota bacterium]
MNHKVLRNNPLCAVVVFFLALFYGNAQEELIFRSGFEPGSVLTQKSNGADITGQDDSFPTKSDWVVDLETHPNIGKFGIQYQDYNANQEHKRRAEIVRNPAGEGHVLKFWLTGDNVTYDRGRVQANLYGAEEGIKEFYQRVKLYLPSSSFNPIIEHPDGFDFLTITEIWNNNNWNPAFGTPNSYPYRMKLNIVKEAGEGKPLKLMATGEQQSRGCCWGEGEDKKWEEISTDTLPLDTWIDIELFIKEGDQNTGNFVLAVTPEGKTKQILFDITGYTHNPDDPNPDGIKLFNPLKMYTKDFSTIDKVTAVGDSLKYYWDDFHLFKNKNIVKEEDDIPENDDDDLPEDDEDDIPEEEEDDIPEDDEDDDIPEDDEDDMPEEEEDDIPEDDEDDVPEEEEENDITEDDDMSIEDDEEGIPIDDDLEDVLIIFPNPSPDGTINLTTSSIDAKSIKVYDLLGRKINHYLLSEDSDGIKLKIEGSTSVYVISVKETDKDSFTYYKLIIN